MHNDRKPLASINVTPLVDVLLILLVVMMLAMPMFVKRLPVELPQTAFTGKPTVVKSLQVSLREDGSMMVDDSLMTLEQVKLRVTATTSVELSIDQAATYDKIAKVVAELQMANPKDIALMVR